ncbi:alkyl hydroperoxide reductase/ thiol specific antioxidant/ Mal allergen, partial [Aureobasidium melanogenum]
AEPAAPEPSAVPAAAPEPESKAASGPPKPGDKIDFDGFGGEIETNDGRKVTLKMLVDESKEGLVLFTYPKASTPGLLSADDDFEGTTQVCLFRDSYEPLTAAGLSIYGLSTDSPKANTTFKDKQKLPYPLLCDPSASLIGAIGLKKAPKGTTRGVFVVKKDGEVLAAEPGGPAATLEVVKGVVAKMGGSGVGEKAEARAAEAEKEETKGAGETAAKL